MTEIRQIRTRTTCAKAVQHAVKHYRVDARKGKVYNAEGIEVGNNVYEPRLTVHIPNRDKSKPTVKYNVRISKVIGFVAMGPQALRRDVQVRHADGNKNNNRSSNLILKYSR